MKEKGAGTAVTQCLPGSNNTGRKKKSDGAAVHLVDRSFIVEQTALIYLSIREICGLRFKDTFQAFPAD